MSPSSLNPYAPIFVPMAYRAVEDFSDEWWDLVHSSPSFRDYWLRECFQDPQTDSLSPDFDDIVLPDFDALFDSYFKKRSYNSNSMFNFAIFFIFYCQNNLLILFSKLAEEEEEEEEEEKQRGDLICLGALRWSKPRVTEAPRYFDKAPKIVNVRLSPRRIHQPR
ncbi:hypothetical protein Ancab_006030 [Ancistrocladus abbreviatus]